MTRLEADVLSTEPDPSPRRGQFALAVALVVCVVIAAGGAGLAGYLTMQANRPERQAWPANWVSAGFVVGDGVDWPTRDRVGELLVLLTDADARYVVRPRGVEVAVQPGERRALDRVRRVAPLHSDLSIRPVRSRARGPAGTGGGPGAPSSCPSGDTCDLGGRRYRLDRPVLTGSQIRAASADGDEDGPGWHVTLSLTASGSRDLSVAASARGRRLAVVMAGMVVMTSRLDGPPGRAMRLNGRLTAERSHRLASACLLSRKPVGVAVGNPG